MRCPECNTRSTIIDTRHRPTHVTRRHFCAECEKRFTTFEIVVETSGPAINRPTPEQMAKIRELSSRGKRNEQR